jgi:predicted RNA polymerase sigma factor
MLLTQLLVDESSLSNSQIVALLALMCFNAARLESRLDEDGHLVPLDQQDHSRWDSALIRRSYTYLSRSSQMESVAATRYHVEAAESGSRGLLQRKIVHPATVGCI